MLMHVNFISKLHSITITFMTFATIYNIKLISFDMISCHKMFLFIYSINQKIDRLYNLMINKSIKH